MPGRMHNDFAWRHLTTLAQYRKIESEDDPADIDILTPTIDMGATLTTTIAYDNRLELGVYLFNLDDFDLNVYANMALGNTPIIGVDRWVLHYMEAISFSKTVILKDLPPVPLRIMAVDWNNPIEDAVVYINYMKSL